MTGLGKYVGVLLLGLWGQAVLFAQDNSRYEYIDRFQEIAIMEMERAGVPASIKLAQGILESAAGESTLARKARNHFGMKCGGIWDGDTYYLEDDDYDENGKLIKSCFRVYRRAEDSYVAHSEFLLDPRKQHRYGFLFRLNPTDYKAWARGLKRAGYATSPTYAEKLIRIIETYELYRFDQVIIDDLDNDLIVDDDRNDSEIDNIRLGIRRINDVKVTTALAGEVVCDVAERTNTRVQRIISFNERLEKPLQKLQEGEHVYLQRKRNNYRGRRKYQIVREGQTMYEIAQMYGLKLRKLYWKNRLPKGAEVAKGEKLKLRGWCRVKRSKIPRLRSEPMPDEGHEFEWDIVDPDPVVDEDPIIIDEEEAEEIVEEVEDTPAYETEYYLVAAGDTLYSIARKHSITINRLKTINRLESDLISTGQLLRIR